MAILNRPVIEITAATADEALALMRQAIGGSLGIVNDPHFKLHIVAGAAGTVRVVKKKKRNPTG